VPRRTLAAAAALVLLVAVVAAVLLGRDDGGGPAPGAAAVPGAPAATERPAGFTRGPYLTRVTTTGARLRWRVGVPGPVSVEATAPDGRVHRARDGLLRGLAPDTRYRWRARTASGDTATGTLTTAPRRLTRPLRLVVFGDYGADTDDERAVGALGARLSPRLVLTTGDNSYLVALPGLLDRNIFRPLRGLLARAPNYGVVGDHDIVFPVGRRALVRAFDWPGGGERYVLRYGPLQIVALGLRADRADVGFLRRALAQPGPAARIVLVHQPPKAGNPVLPVLAAGPVAAVLSGHLHAYERREVAGAPGVPMLTVGTGGARANPGATPRSPDARVFVVRSGLAVLDVGPRRLRLRFVDVAGRVRDRASWPLAGAPAGP